MIRKIFILFIVVLSSCGYEPLYSNKVSSDLSFKIIELQGNKNVNRSIISAMSFKKNSINFSHKKLTLVSKKEILETSKNEKGKPNSFKMILELNFKIEDKQNNFKEKIVVKEFSYKNMDNKFDLSKYEMDVEDDLIDQIIEEIVIYLNI